MSRILTFVLACLGFVAGAAAGAWYVGHQLATVCRDQPGHQLYGVTQMRDRVTCHLAAEPFYGRARLTLPATRE